MVIHVFQVERLPLCFHSPKSRGVPLHLPYTSSCPLRRGPTSSYVMAGIIFEVEMKTSVKVNNICADFRNEVPLNAKPKY
jgi:hypothetical protein